jgi:hypothetical protein
MSSVRPHRTKSMQAAKSPQDKHLVKRYEELLNALRYAVHELPAGVLYGADAANAKQCIELMGDLNEFERLCAQLSRDHGVFCDGCRWHFEHYPHYLGRRRHFNSYEEYIEGRGGPLRV